MTLEKCWSVWCQCNVFPLVLSRSEVNVIAHLVPEKKKIWITWELRKGRCCCSLKRLGGTGCLVAVPGYLEYPSAYPTTWTWVTRRYWKHTHKYLSFALAPNFNNAKSTVWQRGGTVKDNIHSLPHKHYHASLTIPKSFEETHGWRR